MRRRSVLASVLALLAAAPRAIFAAESTGDVSESDYHRIRKELEERLQQGQQDLERVKSEQEVAQQEVDRTRRVQAAADVGLRQVQDQLYAKVEEINATQFQIDRLQVEIHRLTQETVREGAILADEQEIAGGRLRALYKLSRVSPLEVILTASGFSDALNRITILQRILDNDVRHVRATQERKAELDAKRAALMEKQGQVAVLKRQREDQHTELEELKAERASLLASATQRAANARQHNANLEAEKKRREIEQQAFIEEIKALEKWWKEGGFRLPDWAPNGWLRPAAGYISAGYGARTWLQAFHTGIDYAVERLAPVVASQEGRVYKVGHAIPGNRWSSYGMRVIVAHSKNEVSLYAHLDDSRVLPVKEGQYVHKGEILGYVGMTGFTSGPHLHFEIRDSLGRHQNPSNWLR